MALNKKQKIALELLTSGEGMSYKAIAEAAGVSPKTLWNWRNGNDFTEFQEELRKINDARWEATVDAARAAAIRLCKEGKSDFVKFVLQNAGYNPATKQEIELENDIVINVE